MHLNTTLVAFLSFASAITPTFAQSPREVLSTEALNARSWALAPLEITVPPDIRNNLTLLREALLDEGKSATPEGQESYKAGYGLCNLLIAAVDEHDHAAVAAGYRAAQAEANTRMTNQSLDAHAPYRSSWPQYARIKDQRTEIQRQENNKSALAREKVKLDWSNRVKVLQRSLDEAYMRYRQAIREDSNFKGVGSPSTALPPQSTPPPEQPQEPTARPVATEPTEQAWPSHEALAKGSPLEIQDLFTPYSASLPIDTQFTRVLVTIRKLNPEFKGDVVVTNNRKGESQIRISGGLLTNLWPLRALRFDSLRCEQGGRVSDLSPLKGMPLRALFLPGNSDLSDLSPLQGMPLRALFMNGTQVRDLSPLCGTPIEVLAIGSSGVTDYSPLKDMPNLKDLTCDFIVERDSSILRSIPTLERLNHLPVREFWERVDAGESPQSIDYKERRNRNKNE